MRALTLHGTEDLRHERVDDPSIGSPTDVIVRVELSAICGSDLHPYFGRESGYDPGTIPGHEFVGEVVEVGRDVKLFAIGERVHAPFTTSCGVCDPCRSGLTSRCVRGALFGWRQSGQGLHGGQAELVLVPLAESTLLPIPEGIDEVEALLLGDVLSTGFYASEQAAVAPGSAVAVVGCGPVGLMAVVSAIELGAERVVAIDPVEERRAAAERFGADSRSPDEVEELLAETRGAGFLSVIEAVGSPAAAALAFRLTRAGGVLSTVGVHTSSTFAFSPVEAYDRNLTLRIGRCPARALMERLVPLVRSRRFDLASVVTDRVALSDGPAAYRAFAKRRAGTLKFVLEP